MPSVSIKTTSGSVHVNYVVSTPTNSNAKAIDRTLPVVIFLHPVFVSSIIFHNQFNDPSMRKFNLVALDSRGHGLTSCSSPIPQSFGPAQAADDVVKFMDALNIRQAHFFGVSMGTLIATHIAMFHPDRCSSVYSLSPLSIKEPEEVFSGRQEICEYWIEGHRIPDNEDALQDAMYGAVQLGFSNEVDPLINAFIAYTLPLATTNWGPKHLTEYKTITLDFFQADRENYSPAGFKKIKCPVKFLFCSEDVAYTVEQAEELMEMMQDAGVDVSMESVAACHFGHVGEWAEANQSLVNFVQEVDPSTKSLRVPQDVVSPFEPHLRKVGYSGDDEESDWS